MFLAAIPRYFERLGSLLVAPMDGLERAGRGQWNATRDATVLVALAAVTVYTADLTRIFVVGWDLGLREGVNEISWSLGRQLSPDLLFFLIVSVVVIAPLRITARRSFDQSLSLAAACWMPAFGVRLVAATWRMREGLGPARLLQGPEWWIALAWSGALVVLGLMLHLRTPVAATAATDPEDPRDG